ncbi:MAG TPA: cupin domain-containing protein [Burkholderiales bacterium]|nr:cupin domain-containing protein [Burkholderiales bacterium]
MNEIDTASAVQHVYDFAALDRVPDGPTSLAVAPRRLLSGPTLQTGKSSTVGAVLSGSHIIATLGRQARGTGAKAHSHPNEQFNYILAGVMMSDVEGDRVFASRGSILHTPGMAVHTGLACPDEDLVFLAIKDTRHGIVGPPVDGRYDGPNCFAGYGSRANEPPVNTAQVISESRRLPPGPGKRYVYDLRENAMQPPAASSSAMLSEPMASPGIRGRLLTGELLHVAVLRLAPGAALAAHAHDNEQFTFVVEGALDATVENRAFEVKPQCLLHVPARMAHALRAPGGALIVIAQDRRRHYAG